MPKLSDTNKPAKVQARSKNFTTVRATTGTSMAIRNNLSGKRLVKQLQATSDALNKRRGR